MAITPLKMKFGKLIRDYLRNAEIRQNDLAAKLQVSGSAVSQMLHGKIVPNQQQLDVICELLALDRLQAYELRSILSCIRTGAENMRSPFNEFVFSLRCQRGLNHQQLANLSGIPSSHLQVFESCFEAIPTFDEANKLAPILGCTPAALLQSAGVGGLSGRVFDQLEAAGAIGEEEVGEPVAAYHTDRQIPLLNLCDLEAYDGQINIYEFAQRRATKVIEPSSQQQMENTVAVSALGTDLNLGFPGTLQLLLCPERPTGYRELNLCCTTEKRFLLQEVRRGSVKEFRLAGTKKQPSNSLFWSLPVLELVIRPTKPESGRKK